MRRQMIILCALLGFLLLAVQVQAQDVNGELAVVNGIRVLKVWGTHYERGYAEGCLLGDQIGPLFNNFTLGYLFTQGGVFNAALYNQALGALGLVYLVEDKYMDEAQGMIDGWAASGNSLYNALLGRNVTALDLLINSFYMDINYTTQGPWPIEPGNVEGFSYGSAVLSSWGQSTPALGGNMVTTRMMDWVPHPNMINNAMLIVHFPSEPDECNWVNVNWTTGVFAVTGFNEYGVEAYWGTSNHIGTYTFPPYNAIGLSVRNGLEMADYDGDGNHDANDIQASITGRNIIGSWIVNCASSSGAEVLEYRNSMPIAVRTEANNNIAPVVPEDHLLSTNHHRLLFPPWPGCFRYAGVAGALSANPSLTLESQWNVMITYGIIHLPPLEILSHAIIQYAPALDVLKVAFAKTAPSSAPPYYTVIPAYTQPPVQFGVDALFCPIASAAENSAYWKKQVNQHGNVDFTVAELEALGDDIFDRFYVRVANSITVAGVTYAVNPIQALNIADMQATLNYAGKIIYNKACEQYLALLLNVVSGKLGQHLPASVDGAIVSQAIVYINEILNSNPGQARFIAQMINDEEMLPAGAIPLGTPIIIYGNQEPAIAAPVVANEYKLLGAFPNPFNPTTTVSFELPVANRVNLRVYDTAGRLIATLVDGWREAGDHQITFDASGLPSGIYFAKLTAGNYSQVQKMVLMK